MPDGKEFDSRVRAGEDLSRTASEVLIQCMEKFSAAEGSGIVVIWGDEEGCLNIESNMRRPGVVGSLILAADMARNMNR